MKIDLLQWVVGLIIPLLLRYSIIKKPIAKIHAAWIAITLFVINESIFFEIYHFIDHSITRHGYPLTMNDHIDFIAITIVSFIVLVKNTRKAHD